MLSQQVQIKQINMQGKTSESCDFLELQVTNKFEKSTKQNLSLEKSLQNTSKKKNVLFVIKHKTKINERGNAIYAFCERTKKFELN